MHLQIIDSLIIYTFYKYLSLLGTCACMSHDGGVCAASVETLK